MTNDVKTLADLLHARAKANPNDTGIRVRNGEVWEDRTWKQIADRADRIVRLVDGVVEGNVP